MWQAEPQPVAKAGADKADAPGASTSGGASAAAAAGAKTGAAPGGAEAGPSIDELRSRVLGGFKAGFDQARAKFEQAQGAAGGASSSSASEAAGGGDRSDSFAKRLLSEVAKEVRATLGAREAVSSVTQAYSGAVKPASEGSAATDMVLVKQRQTAWGRAKETAWNKAREKFGGNLLFQRLEKLRLRDTAAFKRGAALADDFKEKWETSDHPVVHRMEDIKERVMQVRTFVLSIVRVLSAVHVLRIVHVLSIVQVEGAR